MELRVQIKRKRLSRQWRWTAFAENNRKVATSGESFANKRDAVNIARQLFPNAMLELRDER